MDNQLDDDRDMVGTDAAMLRATRRALREAKMHNVPVPVWRDGRVVWVDADEIVLPPEADAPLSCGEKNGASDAPTVLSDK